MKVSVETETARELRQGGPASLHPPYADRIVYVPIPKKFADAETSGLTYAVTAGVQPHDVHLKDEPKPGPEPGTARATGRAGR
jgi:hypothetical protein